MIRKWWIVMVLIIGSLTMFGQTRGVSVFPSSIVENPQRYGEGIFTHIIQSDNYFRQGQFEEALNSLDYALSQDPYFAEAYVKRAILKHKIGRTTEAYEDFRNARRINPYASELYGFNGPLRKLKILAADYDQWIANGLSRELTASFSTSTAQRLQEIVVQKQNGDILGALTKINALLKVTPQSDPVFYKIRGNILLLLDLHFDAINDYSMAIALDPSLEEAYFNRGIAKIMAYNRSDACYDIQESIYKGYEKGKEILQYFCNF